MGRFRVHVGADDITDVGHVKQPAPLSGHGSRRVARASSDAETDIGDAAGERK
jgi:hypothetical protein